MSDKLSLMKGVYYVEVSGYDGRVFLWELVEDHVFDDLKDGYEI